MRTVTKKIEFSVLRAKDKTPPGTGLSEIALTAFFDDVRQLIANSLKDVMDHDNIIPANIEATIELQVSGHPFRGPVLVKK